MDGAHAPFRAEWDSVGTLVHEKISICFYERSERAIQSEIKHFKTGANLAALSGRI